MKKTYVLWTSDDGYCITCGTLGKCIEWLFYSEKRCEYREINDYSIYKIEHPEHLTPDYWMWGDFYLLNENGEIDDENDEILAKWKLIKLTKSDLKFIKKHLPYK